MSDQSATVSLCSPAAHLCALGRAAPWARQGPEPTEPWSTACGRHAACPTALAAFSPLLPSLWPSSPPTPRDEADVHPRPFLATPAGPQTFTTPSRFPFTRLPSRLFCQCLRLAKFPFVPPLPTLEGPVFAAWTMHLTPVCASLSRLPEAGQGTPLPSVCYLLESSFCKHPPPLPVCVGASRDSPTT